MRRIIIAAALAVGLVVLWAVVLPLTAQPALKPVGATSPALSNALFLCHGPNGIDRACAASLARALVLDAYDHAPTQLTDQICPVNPQVSARGGDGD
jgi:hypothetical protein